MKNAILRPARVMLLIMAAGLAFGAQEPDDPPARGEAQAQTEQFIRYYKTIRLTPSKRRSKSRLSRRSRRPAAPSTRS